MSYIVIRAYIREQRRKSLKAHFLENDATAPERSIPLEDLRTAQREALDQLIREGVVDKVDGEYYFKLENEEAFQEKARRSNAFALCFVFLAVVVLLMIIGKL